MLQTFPRNDASAAPARSGFPPELSEGTPVAVAPYTLYSPRQRWLFLSVLFLVSASNFMDRLVISVLLEPIKREFGASDTLLGLLSGAAFAVTYAVLGVPVARWADRGNRKFIISLALAAWSAMTILCGMAQSFWQLAVARVGVGIGEAGAIPPSQSLIVDYFPPYQRARALAIFLAAGTAGSLLAFVLGGHIAATQGWRAAFIVLGSPGLVLAALTFLVLKEPRAQLGAPTTPASAETFFGTLGVLWRKLSYRYLLVGVTVYMLFAYGALLFVPSYFVRVLGMGIGAAGSAYGSVAAVSALVGTLGGGYLADRLSARDARWVLRFPAIGLALAFPIYLIAFMVRDLTVVLALLGIGGMLLSAALPSIFAGSHMVCGSPRRALSVAILTFFIGLVGAGLGPLVTGMISDAFAPKYGTDALGYAMRVMSVMLLGAAWPMFRAARTFRGDIEA